MDAPQYVHVDEFSDGPVTWKFYYTLHSNLDAHQYVHVDVPWNILVPWMFYYTLHIDMDAPQYVHADVPSDVPHYASPGADSYHPAH